MSKYFRGSAAALLVGLSLFAGCAAPTSTMSAGTARAVTYQLATQADFDTYKAATFSPGDQILLKRGVTFTGMLAPKGSGTSGSPITIGAYGTGNRPIISGGSNAAAVQLKNQEYWVIQDIETTGGNPRGISVYTGLGRSLNYFRITNCVVHNVGGTDTAADSTGKMKGLITFWADASSPAGSQFSDVVVDGCSAYTTQRWAGIVISGSITAADLTSCTNVTVRNSTVYDTYGDGIIVFGAKDWVTLESNVCHDVGKAPVNYLGTPNGIWTWRTNNAVVRYNEVYATHSSGVDGGAFDIDYYNTNNWVEYNYAHDCDAYGVGIFAASDGTANAAFTAVTNNAVVRYNIFANNGREAGTNGSGQGDFYLVTWNGGSLNGVKIYNNTSYWNPAQNDCAVVVWGATFSGSNAKLFQNNLIYSTVPKLVATDSSALKFDYNLYWYTGAATPVFYYNNVSYSSFAAYKTGSGQDAHGKYANPLLTTPTYHGAGKPVAQFKLTTGSPAINAGTNVASVTTDFLGQALPRGGAYDIGAVEF